MIDFILPGDVVIEDGLFIPIPNLPNAFTEDFSEEKSLNYKQGRFILSTFDQIRTRVSQTDFLNNPIEVNKSSISIEILPLQVDATTQDRICNFKLIKILNLLTESIDFPDLGNQVDPLLPDGLITVGEIFPLAQLINAGEQVSYAGGVIRESALNLANLTFNTDGKVFIEAYLKALFVNISTEENNTILPFGKPRVQIISNPFRQVSSLFDGIGVITSNSYNLYLEINYSISIRLKISNDRVTVVS